MSIAINLHPKSFRADAGGPDRATVWIDVQCGHGDYASIHVSNDAECDELIAAATDAKRLMAEAAQGGAS